MLNLPIVTNVDFALSTGDTLAYITKDKKIYLIDENEEVQLVIDDATKDDKVYFNGDLLYLK